MSNVMEEGGEPKNGSDVLQITISCGRLKTSGQPLEDSVRDGHCPERMAEASVNSTWKNEVQQRVLPNISESLKYARVNNSGF